MLEGRWRDPEHGGAGGRLEGCHPPPAVTPLLMCPLCMFWGVRLGGMIQTPALISTNEAL